MVNTDATERQIELAVFKDAMRQGGVGYMHPVDFLRMVLTTAGLAHEIDPVREQALRAMCDEQT